MTKLTQAQKRAEQVRKEFSKWDLTKYKLDYVLQQIGNKHFLEPATVYAIIKRYAQYAEEKK